MVNYSSYLSMVRDKELVEESKLLPEFVRNTDPIIQVSKVEKSSVPGFCFSEVWDNVFTEEECKAIIDSLEKSGELSFWNPVDNESKDFRDVDTVESDMNLFSNFMWERIKCLFSHHKFSISEDDEYSELDTIGEWRASGVYERILFGRYEKGGHFGPHTDGSVCIDANKRTFWTILLYLNSIPEEGGGATSFINQKQKLQKFHKDEDGRDRSIPENVLYKVQPKAGRVVAFFFADMHEGEPVYSGHKKYIIRTDILFNRVNPILTSDTDRKAYKMWIDAQNIAERGDPDTAVSLFKKAFKLSPELASLLKC
ncbi:prolyl 4-hydroxylase alpha subunit [Cryptosporidium ryanae]|uniref:prolyl 4-hydroxylase alpha subunit n=1 Tax=Cryptosporidium ryanae TaxID=515981 RepID=UPI00351A953E|nr:prolyl 4-hydroxylase alpha subunit [Cryptosporidium ryanae]